MLLRLLLPFAFLFAFAHSATAAPTHADERMLAQFDLAQAPDEVRTTLALVLDALAHTDGA